MSIGTYLNFLLALIFVIGLIGVTAWAYRRFVMGRGFAPRFGTGRNARLEVVEVRALDPRRRLVLIRRDGTEHLLLLGPNSETVVERGIAGTRTGSGPEAESSQ